MGSRISALRMSVSDIGQGRAVLEGLVGDLSGLLRGRDLDREPRSTGGARF